MLHRFLDHEKRAEYVNIELAVDIFDRLHAINAGIVDEDVDRAKRVGRLPEQGLNVTFDRDIRPWHADGHSRSTSVSACRTGRTSCSSAGQTRHGDRRSGCRSRWRATSLLMPTRRRRRASCCLVPALQCAWRQHGRQWIGLYGTWRAANQGYTSVSVCVPRGVLMQAIVEAMFVAFAA
jgi:hypothetical protein